MKTFTYLLSTLMAIGGIAAAPVAQTADGAFSGREPGAVASTANDALKGLCDAVGGTQITSTVCKTLTGTDIGVGAASEDGLATVIISGAGLLQGASITVPVESAEGVLKQFSKRHLEPLEPVCIFVL
jgi:hypothetical protein